MSRVTAFQKNVIAALLLLLLKRSAMPGREIATYPLPTIPTHKKKDEKGKTRRKGKEQLADKMAWTRFLKP